MEAIACGVIETTFLKDSGLSVFARSAPMAFFLNVSTPMNQGLQLFQAS
jgi:hypothetical protein